MSRQEPRRAPVRLAFAEPEAAASLGIGLETFRTMVLRGALPTARSFAGRKRWLVSELEFAILKLSEHHGEDHAPQRNPWDRGPSRRIRFFPRKPHEYERHGDERLTREQRKLKYIERMEEWRKAIPGSELNGLEQTVLEQLARHGVDKAVSPAIISRAGPGTQETLELRGYVGIKKSTKDATKTHSIWITKAGMDELQSQKLPRLTYEL